MDITVTIPDKHLARVVDAYASDLGLDALPAIDPETGAEVPVPHVLRDGTAAAKKAALSEHFRNAWTDEIRARIVTHEANTAARDAVAAKRAELGDNPLA